MASHKRQFKLRIWWLAAGYFLFYAPYAALIKGLTNRSWPGIVGPISGFRILPAVVVSTAITLICVVSAKRWWRYLGRREFFGRSLPFPALLVFLSGLGTAIIIGTTTLAFTFPGVSIVFALVLMRGGVLTLAPLVDLTFRRRVRWFSWAALMVSVLAVGLTIRDVNAPRLSSTVVAIIAAYLTGYLMRLPCLTKLAKTYDPEITRRYFVEELLVALVFLLSIPAAWALMGSGEEAQQLRLGFTELFASSITVPAILIGALYGGLYCFGTMLYLDCRENTFCVPLNRGASMLAGVVASFALAGLLGQRVPSSTQLASAGLIGVALLLLSPLHHFQRTTRQLIHAIQLLGNKLSRWMTGRESIPESVPQTLATSQIQNQFSASIDRAGAARRQLLFVCSGNTCRSPMAAAIGKAEIATLLRLPGSVETVPVEVLSAGTSARVGEPMTDEAKQALRELGFQPNGHRAQNLTVELADQVEHIFCMTQSHRTSVIRLAPAAAAKTQCLDPNGDIDDPIGKGMSAYLDCARQIHELVRQRFDELGLYDGRKIGLAGAKGVSLSADSERSV